MSGKYTLYVIGGNFIVRDRYLVFVGGRRQNQGWVDYEYNYKAAGVDKKVCMC